MNRDTAKKLIFTRAVAFAGTLVFSLAMVNNRPGLQERRQRYFAQAAVDGNLRRLQLLHFAGARVNTRSNCCLPLFLASGEGRLDVVRYLLDQGADVNAAEQFGDTALTEAVFNNQFATAKELLFRGAEVNAIGDGGTALDIAINRNNAAMADLLRHRGGKRACEIRTCS
jgi:ankyrin repeat protein